MIILIAKELFIVYNAYFITKGSPIKKKTKDSA